MEIKDLQPHITHFSEQILMNADHMQEVKVGGEITDIISPLIVEIKENPLSTYYILKVDDLVGTIYVYVSKLVMDHYDEILKVGSHVVLDGFTKVLTRQVQSEIRREVSIVAYDAKSLPLGQIA